MARIIDPFTMAFSGKLGDKVGVCGKHGHYIRSVSKKSTKGPSERQLAVRGKFAVVVAFLSPLRDLVESVYSYRVNKKMSIYNRIVSDTLKYAVTGEYPDFHINYRRVQLSRGTLFGVQRVSVKVSGNGMIDLLWDVPCHPRSFYADDVVVVLFNPQKGLHQVERGKACRGDGALRIIPEEVNFQELHIWMFFVSAELRKCSDTVYLGTVGN